MQLRARPDRKTTNMELRSQRTEKATDDEPVESIVSLDKVSEAGAIEDQELMFKEPVKNFCAHALDVNLACKFFTNLPADLRLETYKAAFPEMCRPSDTISPIHKDALVSIQYVERCTGYTGPERDCASAENPCGPCQFRQMFDKLTLAVTSHFARNPSLREEFLYHYFSLIQLHWDRGFERGNAAIPVFSGFFDTYREHVASLKHLTLQLHWKYNGLEAQVPDDSFTPEWMADDGLRTDAFDMGMVFGVLHKHRIKAEVVFLDTNECRRPFFERVEALCKEWLKRGGEPFWETKDREMEDLFRYDEELRQCADEAVALEAESRQQWAGKAVEMKYNVDFSE